MKKIIAIIMALVMVLTLASCGSSKSDRDAISAKIDALSEKLEAVKEAAESAGSNGGSGGGDIGGGEEEPIDDPGEDVTGEVVTDASGEAVTNAEGETQTAAPKTTKTNKTTTKNGSSGTTSNDPSKWTTAQIVDYYKKAANATKGKSAQKMTIQEVPGVLNLLKGPINNALEKRSTPFDGITGGYKSLQASDLTSANAKASGNYVIINLFPKEQIDGAYGKATEGTTGHVVSVLDGVATAVDALGVSAEYPEGSVKLDYKNGYAKNIKINTKTGKIESGEWGYDLYITINGAKLAGIKLTNVNALILYRVNFPA